MATRFGVLKGKAFDFVKKILRVIIIVDNIDLDGLVIVVTATAKDVGDRVECSWNPLNGELFALEIVKPSGLSFGDGLLGKEPLEGFLIASQDDWAVVDVGAEKSYTVD